MIKRRACGTLQNVLLQHAHVAVIGSDWALIDGFFFSAASIDRKTAPRSVHDLNDVEAHWPGAVTSLTDWLRMLLGCREASCCNSASHSSQAQER